MNFDVKIIPALHQKTAIYQAYSNHHKMFYCTYVKVYKRTLD